MLKKYELFVSSLAKLQIDEILHYIAVEKKQPLNASKFLEKLENKLLQIQKRPFSFSENELKKTQKKIYRKAKIFKYIIFYKVKQEVIIIAFIHSSRSNAKTKKEFNKGIKSIASKNSKNKK